MEVKMRESWTGLYKNRPTRRNMVSSLYAPLGDKPDKRSHVGANVESVLWLALLRCMGLCNQMWIWYSFSKSLTVLMLLCCASSNAADGKCHIVHVLPGLENNRSPLHIHWGDCCHNQKLKRKITSSVDVEKQNFALIYFIGPFAMKTVCCFSRG